MASHIVALKQALPQQGSASSVLCFGGVRIRIIALASGYGRYGTGVRIRAGTGVRIRASAI